MIEKNKMFPVVGIILLLLQNSLFGDCVYWACEPSIPRNIAQLEKVIDNEFVKIERTIDTINKDNDKYSEALIQLNESYRKNEILKKEYLVVLKNIAFELKKIKNIER